MRQKMLTKIYFLPKNEKFLLHSNNGNSKIKNLKKFHFFCDKTPDFFAYILGGKNACLRIKLKWKC